MQQVEAAQTAHERTTLPHLGGTVEGVVVAAEPMSAHFAPSVGVTTEMPRRVDSDVSNAEYKT